MRALDNPFKVGDQVVCIDDSHDSFYMREVAVEDVRKSSILVRSASHESPIWLSHLKFTHRAGADKIAEIVTKGSTHHVSDEELTKDAKTGSDKRRFSLFPVEALQAALDVIESGNIDLPWRKAYPIDSWKRKSGDYKRRYLDALSRHLFDYIRGEHFTEDTGLYTMAAVMVNSAFLLQFEIEELGIYPSNDGKKEIENMRKGKGAYSSKEVG